MGISMVWGLPPMVIPFMDMVVSQTDHFGITWGYSSKIKVYYAMPPTMDKSHAGVP